MQFQRLMEQMDRPKVPLYFAMTVITIRSPFVEKLNTHTMVFHIGQHKIHHSKKIFLLILQYLKSHVISLHKLIGMKMMKNQ